MANSKKLNSEQRRQFRIRNKIKKSGRVRLSVHKSSKHIYAQLIDDKQGKTLASASTLDKDLRKSVKNGGNVEAAKAVGKLVAERASKVKDIGPVVFDRGRFIFHGRVKALADSAREAGLEF